LRLIALNAVNARETYGSIYSKKELKWGKGRGSGVARITSERGARLYCDDCKKDLFEGVKLRKEFKR